MTCASLTAEAPTRRTPDKRAAMQGYLFDTDAVIDLCRARSELLEPIRTAATDGRIELLATHISLDEMVRYKGTEEGAHQLAMVWGMFRQIPAAVLVMGFSRWDFARASGPELDDVFERLAGPRTDHDVRDAIVAVTAYADGLPLVTNDKGLRERGAAEGIDVFSLAELLGRVQAQGETE